MSRVLITGGSGRFAGYVVAALRDRYDLVLFSRTKPPEDRADLPWIRGDLNVYEDCRRAMEGVDLVQHLGAVPSPSDHPQVRASRQAQGLPEQTFDATMHTNIMGTYYLLMAAVQAGVRTMVMTGSNCAFGHGYRISERPFPIQYLPLDENHPSDVEDSYSYSKLVGEELLASFTKAYGLRTYVTRPSGICPPARLQRMAETAAPITAWNEWMWAYVASEDLAELQAMIMEKADALPKHSVYVANALDSSALEPSLEIVAKFRPELIPVSKLSAHQALWSTAKAQAEVGWMPKHSWRDYLPGR
jgi:nucleoside-diphosphate-sugar epimerase